MEGIFFNYNNLMPPIFHKAKAGKSENLKNWSLQFLQHGGIFQVMQVAKPQDRSNNFLYISNIIKLGFDL